MNEQKTTFDLVTSVWGNAFYKGNRLSTQGNRLDAFFEVYADRYAFDFSLCGMESDWYQFYTLEDASYYGHWFNPVRLMIVSYIEGDIYVTTCDTVEAYKDELAAAIAYHGDKAHGIDDHDGRHAVKLLTQEEPEPVEA